MTEKILTNAYIVGMYLLKNENINIKKIHNKLNGIIIEYNHKRYGGRSVYITEDTDIERIFFAIDNDGDEDYEYERGR